jgi:hypothetical protein
LEFRVREDMRQKGPGAYLMARHKYNHVIMADRLLRFDFCIKWVRRIKCKIERIRTPCLVMRVE